MFRLSNKIFQVNFFDNSQILLNTDEKTVLFTSKKGAKTYETLAKALQAKDTEMARRIKYTKEILNSIKKGKDDLGVPDQKWLKAIYEVKANMALLKKSIFIVFHLFPAKKVCTRFNKKYKIFTFLL